jgi:cytosine/uracil/thiamine/allantoin permease
MPFWAITAFKQRRIYRLLLKVTIEMQTLGGNMMKLGVVQSKDLSAANPTTLDPTRAKIILPAV